MTLSWHFLDACHVKVHDNPRDCRMLSYVTMVLPYKNCYTATLSGRSRRNSVAAKGLQLSRFGSSSIYSASYRPIRSGGGWTGCHWKRLELQEWRYPNRRCLIFDFFDKQYDCWFYVFSMMTAQHIRNYKKNQHIWNSLAPRMSGGLRPPSVSCFFQSTGPVESFGATVQWRK